MNNYRVALLVSSGSYLREFSRKLGQVCVCSKLEKVEPLGEPAKALGWEAWLF